MARTTSIPGYRTRTIAGRKIFLPTDRIYLASRPTVDGSQQTFDVIIHDITERDPLYGTVAKTLSGLTCNQANEFLKMFNGSSGPSGRAW